MTTVLILVVMDDALALDRDTNGELTICSLNPCCNG